MACNLLIFFKTYVLGVNPLAFKQRFPLHSCTMLLKKGRVGFFLVEINRKYEHENAWLAFAQTCISYKAKHVCSLTSMLCIKFQPKHSFEGELYTFKAGTYFRYNQTMKEVNTLRRKLRLPVQSTML